jgi:putative endonuclease
MRGARDTAARRRAERHGRGAETRALLALLVKGYLPLARRVRTPVGEIDLIVKRGRVLAFVEVKARADAEEALAAAARSRERILRAAEWWLAAHPRHAKAEPRFDVVLIAPGRFPAHIPGAFDAFS